MPSRCCIGLFAAADALGLGFVRGVPLHLYLEHLDLDVLQRMGLSIEGSERGADVYIHPFQQGVHLSRGRDAGEPASIRRPQV